MKGNRFFRILAAAVVLSLLMIAIPATPVLGAAAITLSASTGPTGTVITVSGTGFTLDAVGGYVWFDSDGDSILDSGEPSLSATVNGLGVLVVSGSITVPSVPRATYYVRAEVPYDITADDDAHAPFVVTPQITLDDADGNVGDTISVDGTGFAAGSVTILYDSVSKGTTTASATGAFNNFTFTAPAGVKGSHTVKAQETSSTSNNDEVTYTVSPKITITPTSGAVGDEVTITGTGFAAGKDITIYFDTGSEDITDGDDETDSTGGFECTFDVPGAARGSHTVKAQDSSSNYATATFTVSASIALDPDSGSSGTTVTVTGTGFRVSHDITVTYDGEEVDIAGGDDATDSDGSFEFTFTVPAKNAGTYEVEVTDGTNTATADFESTTSATISPVTSASSPGYVGEEVTITGVGFTPGATITITYASTPTTFTTTADGSGNFTKPIIIPASEGGTHTITVSDTVITKTFTFYMESEAPAVPSLTLPLVGEKLEDGIFSWAGVDDLSKPITYDLQVSTDSSFATSSLLVNKTGLTTATYTLSETEKLESTGKDEPYYWQVRAVDAASNASAWSSAGTFTVGFSIEISVAAWIIIAAAAVVFFIIGLFVGKAGGGGGYY